MRAVKIDHKPGQTGRGIDCSAKEKFRFAAIGKSICSSNDRDDGDQEMGKTKTILSDLSKQPRDASDQDESYCQGTYEKTYVVCHLVFSQSILFEG